MQAVLDQGYLDGLSETARGIATLVIDAGVGALSEAQKHFYEREVVPELQKAPPDEELLVGD